jgi:hypothetical protein
MHRADHVVVANLGTDAQELAVPVGLVPLLDWTGRARVDGDRLQVPAQSAVVLGPA